MMEKDKKKINHETDSQDNLAHKKIKYKFRKSQ